MKTQLLPRPKCFALAVLLFVFLLLANQNHSLAQPSTQGYRCSTHTIANSTAYPCQTYVFYSASSPNFLDLASIGDLFSVSRLMISHPSNISNPSSPLLPDQSLFIPISCGCNFTPNLTHSISYANLTYRILEGDTFWLLSTQSYRSLTTYQSVEAVNPQLDHSMLDIGQDVIFPVFCKCPNQTQIGRGVQFLISYVFQPGDSLASVAAKLGSTRSEIVGVNGNNIQDFDTVFVPVSKLPTLRQPIVSPQNGTSPSGTSPAGKKVNKAAVIGLAVGLGVCVILLGLVCGLLVCTLLFGKKRIGDEVEEMRKVGKGLGKGSGAADIAAKVSYTSLGMNFLADVSEILDKYRVFEIDDLNKATEGFDDKYLIEGSVHKCCIDGGPLLAVKKMQWNAFEELKILQKVNHGSLVKLEGFCVDPGNASCYLVYEYIENGSLHSWLHDDNKRNLLNWKKRLGIAIDIAIGLQYIHEHTRPQVVHKDIKSSNILLDGDFRAKIADFGLAKSGCNAMTMHIVGTQGYMAPEYLADGIVSTKMDVFSFGVVLLELVSGKGAISRDGKQALWISAQRVAVDSDDEDDEGNETEMMRLKDWMDQSLVEDSSCTMESVMTVMELAVACVNRDPNKRPGMVEIVYGLSKCDDAFVDITAKGQ